MVNAHSAHPVLFIPQQCSPEVFLEGLLLPCLTGGQMTRLQENMLALDPSLDIWSVYLTAACRHFSKNKLMHVLYQFQLFMKVRSVTSQCIRILSHFYVEVNVSYETPPLNSVVRFLPRQFSLRQVILDVIQSPLLLFPKTSIPITL